MTDNASTSASLSSCFLSSFCLSKEQIETFNRDGVLVVENVLNEMELQQARKGLEETLIFHGIKASDLENTGSNIQKLSSTNGSGGVLDLFYPSWKLTVATNPKLFAATQQLWDHCYCHNGETQEEQQRLEGSTSNSENDNNHNHGWQWHPYGPFDVHRGYMYMDRIGYRLPTKMAQLLGERATTTTTPSSSAMNEAEEAGNGIENSTKVQSLHNVPSCIDKQQKKKKKTVSIQRCLTPHLDCCPTKLFSADATKFRPIQCFVSLTDNEEPNTGGFEAAPGFHQIFHKWVQDRPPTIITKKKKKKQKQQSKKSNRRRANRLEKEKEQQPQQEDVGDVPVEVVSFPAPCVGDYTHIRPTEDRDVMKKIQHIPVKAGSAVFWDNRIPHGNAYLNTSLEPRAVVYCSFLPDIPLNRTFVKQQLVNWQQHQRPTDFWIRLENNEEADNNHTPQPHFLDNATTMTTNSSEPKTHNSNLLEPLEDKSYQWSSLGRKLIGLDPW